MVTQDTKDTTLHTLKQIKTQMGKIRKKANTENELALVNECMKRLDLNIAWITSNWAINHE